jgi:hypothetical protein
MSTSTEDLRIYFRQTEGKEKKNLFSTNPRRGKKEFALEKAEEEKQKKKLLVSTDPKESCGMLPFSTKQKKVGIWFLRETLREKMATQKMEIMGHAQLCMSMITRRAPDSLFIVS